MQSIRTTFARTSFTKPTQISLVNTTKRFQTPSKSQAAYEAAAAMSTSKSVGDLNIESKNIKAASGVDLSDHQRTIIGSVNPSPPSLLKADARLRLSSAATSEDMVQVRQRKRDIVESFRGGSEARLQKVGGLEVIEGDATFTSANSLSVKLAGGAKLSLEANTFFINTGERPTPREDAEFADEVKKICEGEGLEILTNAAAISIRADQSGLCPIVLTCAVTGDSVTEVRVVGSHILFATGRTPNTDTLDLAKAGVEVDKRGHITVSPTLQTSAPHIYALGDCHGGPAFTHISYDDFRIIKANFIDSREQQATTTDRMVPYVVYIDPQLGHIGLHEHEARAQSPDKTIQTATMPMSYVARALETDETRGLMKAVVDAESEQILGFTCLGMEGGEIMSIVQVAMMGQLPYTRLQQAVFAHPTLAESLNNLWGFLK
ncbi:hypothetical protein B0A55_12275 [Friedmanniomyces simplex]|uniref:Pyridine nucleotide-disulphide oxidoreductase dimerisation domain-containing protein n=1 Tax=Friedmanniomyces simplex TaxID=329884 RepID=A0A4U0WJL8_9PEZI|nr:hypothetical protein B0A55_12275 [Friedmanniomyces simplex]